MKRELLRKYVWLVNTIRRHKKITFEEIAKEWSTASDNLDGSELALRTFHNHRDSIETLFGIRIECGRTDGNRYYISTEGGEGITRLKVWMLTDLSMSHRVQGGGKLGDRILLDTDNMDAFYLSIIIDAMKMDVTMMMEYEEDNGDTRHYEVGAYALRFRNGRWLLAAFVDNPDDVRVFYLDKILSCSATENYFSFPHTFNPDAFFNNYFGIDVIGIDGTPRVISILARGTVRDKLRKESLHPTQKEIVDMGSESVFNYRFILSEEFLLQMLRFGTEAEVLSPASLRNEIKKRLEQMLSNYSQRPDPVIAYKIKTATAKKE